MKQRLIVSTVGTSLLTNIKGLLPEERKLIYTHANAKTRERVPEPDQTTLEHIIDTAFEQFEKADEKTRQALSAEYNAISRLRDDAFVDQHLLIITDTWLGRETAGILEATLGNHTIIWDISGLQTSDLDGFRAACIELARRGKEDIEANYSSKGVRVVFNLTGGFKAVQGFMQTLGMLYADEVVYIFERSENLIRIPRLPIRIDAKDVIRKSIKVWRRLEVGLPVSRHDPDLKDVPDFYFLPVDDQIMLSEWGEVVWRDLRDAILSERLWPSPDEKVRFGPGFERTVASVSKEERLNINTRIAELARCLHDRFYNPEHLNFEKLNRTYSGSTHECYAWSKAGAKRLFGHYEGKVFVLDRLDDHL